MEKLLISFLNRLYLNCIVPSVDILVDNIRGTIENGYELGYEKRDNCYYVNFIKDNVVIVFELNARDVIKKIRIE